MSLSLFLLNYWIYANQFILFSVYDLAIASYLIALLHFGSEWLIYKTVKFGRGLAGPLVVSTLSLVWLSSQRDYYLSL